MKHMTPDRIKYFTELDNVVSKIGRQHLCGLGPEKQGAVLANLVAVWLAGHQGPDAVEVRKEIFTVWLKTVHDLVPVCDAEIMAGIETSAACCRG